MSNDESARRILDQITSEIEEFYRNKIIPLTTATHTMRSGLTRPERNDPKIDEIKMLLAESDALNTAAHMILDALHSNRFHPGTGLDVLAAAVQSVLKACEEIAALATAKQHQASELLSRH